MTCQPCELVMVTGSHNLQLCYQLFLYTVQAKAMRHTVYIWLIALLLHAGLP